MLIYLLFPLISCFLIQETLKQPFDGFVSDLARVELVSTGLSGARSMLVDPQGFILTIARDLQQVVGIAETDTSHKAFMVMNATGFGLNWNHGLTLHDSYLYLSSDTTVYRFPYTNGMTEHDMSTVQVVVVNIPNFYCDVPPCPHAPQGHTTRTILFSPSDGLLYIGISSGSNVDVDTKRARVVRFNITSATLPVDWADGELWAEGMRNPLALAFDSNNTLWELDNGPDNANRTDLGLDIHPDNPPEELNKLDGPKFYGYPLCFSIGNLTQPFGRDPDYLKQYSWIQSPDIDLLCQNTSFNTPPLLGLPAHSSPIQMKFINDSDGCNSVPFSSFPCDWNGDLITTLHGSWDRPIPVGYSINRIPFKNFNPVGINSVVKLAWTRDYETKCLSADGGNTKCFRPAGLSVRNGMLYLSSDATGHIVRLLFNQSSWTAVGSNPSTRGSISASTGSFNPLFIFLLVLLLM